MSERARRLTRATRIELERDRDVPVRFERNEASVLSRRSGSSLRLIGRSLTRPLDSNVSFRLCPSPEPGDNGSSRSAS